MNTSSKSLNAPASQDFKCSSSNTNKTDAAFVDFASVFIVSVNNQCGYEQ